MGRLSDLGRPERPPYGSYKGGPIKKEPCDEAPPCAKDSELEYAVFGDGLDN